MESHSEHDFVRTVCDCKQCTACCKRQPGPLAPGDYERIREHLQASEDQMEALFWASPGAMVRDHYGRTRRVGTITPRYRKGRCVFLDENDKCKIHGVAPFGCAFFDTHMSHREAQRRAQWLAFAQDESAQYRELRAKLPYATHHKPLKYDL
jgi:Fe-S-cluster containining protein